MKLLYAGAAIIKRTYGSRTCPEHLPRSHAFRRHFCRCREPATRSSKPTVRAAYLLRRRRSRITTIRPRTIRTNYGRFGRSSGPVNTTVQQFRKIDPF